jgi:hypothetical protein
MNFSRSRVNENALEIAIPGRSSARGAVHIHDIRHRRRSGAASRSINVRGYGFPDAQLRI